MKNTIYRQFPQITLFFNVRPCSSASCAWLWAITNPEGWLMRHGRLPGHTPAILEGARHVPGGLERGGVPVRRLPVYRSSRGVYRNWGMPAVALRIRSCWGCVLARTSRRVQKTGSSYFIFALLKTLSRLAHWRQLNGKNTKINAHKPFSLSLSKRERRPSSFDKLRTNGKNVWKKS